MPSGPTLVTPNAQTFLLIDVPEPVLARPPWHIRRSGRQISRARTERNNSVNVNLQPGEGWTLSPLKDDLTRVNHADFDDSVITDTDVNLATHWTTQDTFRRSDDLPDVDASASLIASGSPAFTKRVQAGSNWSGELLADVTAFPKPALLSEDYPMDRVLSGKVTYPANCGFVVIFSTPGSYHVPDNILTFYFGGQTETYPTGTRGGEFLITLRGDGRAVLKERTAGGWAQRMDFLWLQGSRAGTLQTYALWIFPYGRDTIAIRTTAVDIGAARAGFSNLPLGLVRSEPVRDAHFYRSGRLISGYHPGRFVTGPGVIRLDVRRDLRTLIQIARLKPPEEGTLTDLPFWIPFPLPAGTALTISGDTYLPPGTGIAGALFTADGVALTPTGSNSWQSAAGVQSYYATFTLAADAAQEQTPVLWGYNVEVAGVESSRSPTPTAIIPVNVSITGPDLDPTHESASVTLEDVKNLAPGLRVRGRQHCQIAVYSDAGVLTSVLFEGENARAQAVLRGRPGRLYPSPDWRRYEVSLTGMWARLADFVNLDLVTFHVDESAPESPAWGGKPPWKITDIIRFLLRKAGFPLTALDIPDLPLRLWPGQGGTQEDFILQPTASVADFVLKLARDYLGMTLLWDPNAGAAGMWRLIFNRLVGTGTPLAAFLQEPAVAGRLPTHPNSYAAGTAFIRRESFATYVRPPEANYVVVVGAGSMLPGHGGPTQLTAFLYNPLSFDFLAATSDPTHPDYLGRFVPVLHVDPTLWTPEAVGFVCRRLYDRIAHAEKWCQFEAPLLLIEDASDAQQVRPRPLRVNDPVLVLGAPALVRSCNPSYQHDGVQFAAYECLLGN